jgi:hypothetical protein
MPRTRSPRSWSGTCCATSIPTWPTGLCRSVRAAGTTNCGGSAVTSPSGCPGRRREQTPCCSRSTPRCCPRHAPAAAGPRPSAWASPPGGSRGPGSSPPGSRATPPTEPPVTRGAEAAEALAAFLTGPAPGRPGHGARRQRQRRSAGRLHGRLRPPPHATVDLGLILDPDAVRAIWDDAVTVPAWDRRRCGSTGTSTRPTSSPRTAPSAA